MAQHERVLVDMTIDAEPAVVWSALSDPDQVRHWFGWDYDGLAAEIQDIFSAQAEADPETMTLRWADGDRFVVEPDGDTARLIVLRRGHEGTEGFDGVFDPIDEGWITFAQQLRFGMERHRGQERRTVSALGVDLGSEDDALLDRLGLRPLGANPVGAEYTVQRPDGTSFSGSVFFQTDLQVGLSVQEEGDALLVVARTPPSSAPPHGEAMFVLSTYDLDDAAFAEVEQRWTAWWSPTQD